MKARALIAMAAVAAAASAVSGAPSATKGVHAIVVWDGDAPGMLLGGVIDGKWANLEHIVRRLKGGEQYRVYTLTKYLGHATGAKPELDEGAEYPEAGAYDITLRPAPKVKDWAVAIQGTWQAMPRIPRAESPKQTVCQEIVRGALREKGLAGVPVNVTQFIRVDLEGDGSTEELVAARNPLKYDEFARPGYYSAVILRKMVNGKRRTLVVAGEFYPNHPAPKNPNWGTPGIFDVAAVLDADADGVMEVFVGWRGYEGEAVGVYRVRGAETKLLLGVYWGL